MQRRSLCAGLVFLALVQDAPAAEFTLERVVLISRHGVRSPTDPASLPDFASRPWPTWPVPAGYLTPRGEKLATLMGGYYRKHFAARGLLPAKGCPKPNEALSVGGRRSAHAADRCGAARGHVSGLRPKRSQRADRQARSALSSCAGRRLLDRRRARAGIRACAGGRQFGNGASALPRAAAAAAGCAGLLRTQALQRWRKALHAGDAAVTRSMCGRRTAACV